VQSVIKEKLAVCHTCCGPTYRESAKRQLNTTYFDDDNIYYCILTDDKSYFNDVNRKNLVVNELKDFYHEFPDLEKNEAFLESMSKEDYAEKFQHDNYLFSFSAYRFNILQAIRLGISNISLLCTDTHMNLLGDGIWGFDNSYFDKKPFLYNVVSQWDESINEPTISGKKLSIISDLLKEKYNLTVNETVRLVDAAARLFLFKDTNQALEFFNVWNGIIETLYERNLINLYKGHYVIHDEYILAPIYDVFEIPKTQDVRRIFTVKHDMVNERFWQYS